MCGEKKQASAQSHWDSLPQQYVAQKYTFSHYNDRKARRDTNPGQSSCQLKNITTQQTWWVSSATENRHGGWIDSCVHSFCLCAASPPRHDLPSWTLCQPERRAAPGVTLQIRPTRCSRSPPEAVQRLELVVPLCNAVTRSTSGTWLQVKCDHRQVYVRKGVLNQEPHYRHIYRFTTQYLRNNINLNCAL